MAKVRVVGLEKVAQMAGVPGAGGYGAVTGVQPQAGINADPNTGAVLQRLYQSDMGTFQRIATQVLSTNPAPLKAVVSEYPAYVTGSASIMTALLNDPNLRNNLWRQPAFVQGMLTADPAMAQRVSVALAQNQGAMAGYETGEAV
jgi:hypothetical protein